MIRFHNPPKDPEAVLAKVRELVGEPHAHDGQTFLFNHEMPHRRSMIELYRAGGYPVDLEYVNEGRQVRLKDGSLHSHLGGRWTKHVNV